jgi:hypothetical protein
MPTAGTTDTTVTTSGRVSLVAQRAVVVYRTFTRTTCDAVNAFVTLLCA